MAIVIKATVDSGGKYNNLGTANATWSTARSASSGALSASPNPYCTLYSGDNLYYIYRAFLVFDTSTLTGNVTGCTLTIYNTADGTGINGSGNIYASTEVTAGTLATTDYPNCGTTAYSDTNWTYSNAAAGVAYTLTLNATGLSALNTARLASSPFLVCIRNAEKDVANVAPSSGYEAGFPFSNPSVSGKEPYISATISAGATSNNLTLLGVGT